MIPLDYAVLRVVRKLLPERVMNWLLQRRLLVRPGLETREPQDAADRYQAKLESMGRSLSGKGIFILGYGGHLGLGVELLNRGARHVVLYDPYARADDTANQRLAEGAPDYFTIQEETVIPDPDRLTLIHEDILFRLRGELPEQDVVLSSSVYEHLEDPALVTQGLAILTAEEGVQLHYIDLRDHFFKYPFEMLCHSERIWKRFFNPGSNLNRYRVRDYQQVFECCFDQVEWQALGRDVVAFQQVLDRIRPEFKTGNIELDAVTEVVFSLQGPRR